jgi:hypothetical protein
MDPILWMQAANLKKTSEEDGSILKMLLECVLLLCQDRESRDILRQRKVYYVCRNLEEMLHDDELSGIIFDIANLLMRDEDTS